MRHPLRSGLVVVALLLTSAAAAGCAALGPNAADADAVASQFSTALDESNGAAACDLLNERARSAVEDASGSDCAEGILTLGIPASGDPVTSEVYGRSALVETDSDSLFMTVGGASWLIRAAGCTPRENEPFDCLIEGS
jgi:hypothetical protein